MLLSANSIVFSSSVDDPWYSAHSHPLQVTVDSNADTASGTVYFADRPVSALGCAEQYQLCANQGADCTPLTSWYGIRKDLEALTTTRRQRAIGNLLLDASTTTVGDTVTTLRDSSLGASFSKFGSVQGSIPSNQWIIDVEGWAAISLARIQRNVLEYASGPSDRRLLPYLNTPNDTVEHDLCHNIKARTRRVENFSVLAIALIFSLGALITIINFGLDFLIGLVQSKRNAADYRRLAWKTNGLLQLQRLAHEEMGYGSWERCTNETPVTRFGDMLASISVDNPKHPTLQKKTENIGPIRTSSNPSPKKEPTVTQSQPLPTQSSSASTRSNPSSNTAMPVSSIPSSLSPSPPTQSTEKRSSSADPSIPALPYSTRT